MQVGADDATVKLRPIDPDHLPAELRKSPSFGVEVDAIPGGFVCSGSMKAEGSLGVRDVLHGDRPIKKLFTKEQRQFYAEHAPEGLDLNDLSILGPINVFKLKWKPWTSPARSSASCGTTPTDRASSSCRRSACLPTPSRRRRGRAFLGSKGIDTAASRPPRPALRSSSSATELKSLEQ